MHNNTNKSDMFITRSYFISRHDTNGCGRPGCYRVVAENVPYAYMLGVKPGEVNFNAVVDDFGNLVRVQ